MFDQLKTFLNDGKLCDKKDLVLERTCGNFVSVCRKKEGENKSVEYIDD